MTARFSMSEAQLLAQGVVDTTVLGAGRWVYGEELLELLRPSMTSILINFSYIATFSKLLN